VDDVNRAIASSKSCPIDPLPTVFIKEFLQELIPFLTGKKKRGSEITLKIF